MSWQDEAGAGGWYQWHSGSLTGPVRRGTMEEEEEEGEGDKEGT